MEILRDFGKRVKELRLKAGITQESLAIRAELDRSYVGAIERGVKNLSLLNIEKLANALDVDLPYLFEHESFAPRSSILRKELKKPLENRFLCNIDKDEQVIAWRVAGPLNEQDVKEISKKIKSLAMLLRKGEIKLLIDNRSMMIDGQPFVFAPEVYDVWEELQEWLCPYIDQVVVLCNSTFMRNQLDRLAKRSGIGCFSKHIYSEDVEKSNAKALEFLGITESRILLKPTADAEKGSYVSV
ncbi:helix-turn-helix domain-containing protein [Planomicrobium sp. CPCC 101110]|uniref:helix-turn-helix domain-containing protein n=1 Tax=Planomicrobium sp. CPCC 101110 TaxID=2599619 RepID=UPI0011B6C18C|nr:helix-turn-helix transcriptional regulator [Planomicrobium sp. CPCC 101110]TWT25161.1 helix-turn-helix transcriptional regulator [Planomicrobium sp. CPCC 101110]